MSSPDDFEDDGGQMRAELKRLEAEIQAHPGSVMYYLFIDVRRAFETWYGNSNDLHALLHHGETDSKMMTELMRNVGSTEPREAYIRALDRTLQAFSGSLGGLIDQTRRVRDKQPESIQKEYDDRSAVVRNLPGANFLRQYRNYMLHYGQAPWWFKGEFKAKGEDTAEVLLDADALLQWKGWDEGSKKFLEPRREDGVRLTSFLPDYHRGMTDLFNWFLTAGPEANEADFEAANQLVAKRNLALTGGIHDGKDIEKFWEHVAENVKRADRGEPQIDFQTGEPMSDEEPGKG